MIIHGEKNRFSVRTEIQKAFMELLSEKNYIDITVTDIVKKANVARTSFYRNFNSIGDLVDFIVDERYTFFEEEVLPVLTSDDERKWREFLFHFFYEVSRDYKRLPPQNICNMQNMSIFFIKTSEKMNRLKKEQSANNIKDKYCAVGKMALISDIAKKWANTGMTETPEEMVDYIMSFITKF